MTRRRTEEPEGEIVIPVTPMLDMTFQLLIFFIITFNPNRMIEGFWDVTVSEDTADIQKDKGFTGTSNDQQKLAGDPKNNFDVLQLRFNENQSKSYVQKDAEGFRKFLEVKRILDERDPNPAAHSEDYPRPIEQQEIDRITDRPERMLAQDLAQLDRKCFFGALVSDIQPGGGIQGKPDEFHSFDELNTKLTDRFKALRERVEKDRAGIADKSERDAAIARDLADYKLVLSGSKTLRWWRFNQARDLAYQAGFRNIQPGPSLPD